ncbi:hypothetical protein WJX81_000737 [Elliptochloris bilobata]|uniref:Uncharacterized protein n=1 Tax=Elliptochloris bilobata TaxID=381761 RepID=A0AAW1S9J4_9CHLO
MTVREVPIAEGLVLTVIEHSELADCAGAVVWDAALVLIHFLAKGTGRNLLRGKRVLDLGAGTGAAGLAAGLLGARVLLTDLPHLLPGLTRNVAANELQEHVAVAALRGRVLLAYERRPLVVERAFAEFSRVGLVAEQVPTEELHPHWQSPDIFLFWLRPGPRPTPHAWPGAL